MKTTTLKAEFKQVAIRLTPDQWVKVNHYLIDHDLKLQTLVLRLLDGEIGLK